MCDSEGVFVALLLVAIIVVFAVFYSPPRRAPKGAFCGSLVADIDTATPCALVASTEGLVLAPPPRQEDDRSAPPMATPPWPEDGRCAAPAPRGAAALAAATLAANGHLGVPREFIPVNVPLRVSDDIDYYFQGSAHIKDAGMLDNYTIPDHYPVTG